MSPKARARARDHWEAAAACACREHGDGEQRTFSAALISCAAFSFSCQSTSSTSKSRSEPPGIVGGDPRSPYAEATRPLARRRLAQRRQQGVKGRSIFGRTVLRAAAEHRLLPPLHRRHTAVPAADDLPSVDRELEILPTATSKLWLANKIRRGTLRLTCRTWHRFQSTFRRNAP